MSKISSAQVSTFGKSARHRVRCDVPCFIVNLDLEPEKRWSHILPHFRQYIPPVLEFIREMIGTGFISKVVSTALSGVCRAGGIHFRRELIAVSKLLQINLGQVVMLHIAYEVMTCCTSIVVDGSEGFPLHIRTMDWDMECLKPLTIQIDFRRHGKTVFKASTWAGMVGIATGMRVGVGAYSISLNYRRNKADVSMQGVVLNILSGWLGRNWPAMFLIRQILEDEAGFKTAVSLLSGSKIMAPCYFIVGGVARGEGAIISRTRSATLHPWYLGCDGDCVQVNIDHWKGDAGEPLDADICHSLERRKKTRTILQRLRDRNEVTMENLWTILALPPMLAYDTVYTVSMCPRTGEYTTVVNCSPQRKREAKQKFGSIIKYLQLLDNLVELSDGELSIAALKEMLINYKLEQIGDRRRGRYAKELKGDIDIISKISDEEVLRHIQMYPPGSEDVESAERM